MTDNKEYFIKLLSSFLNNTEPQICENVNWQEIYRLSNIHYLNAIIANQMLKLDEKHMPDEELTSFFRQQLGYTIISYNAKEEIYNKIKELFYENKIKFLAVKGAVIKKYYPVEELRSSGDIDFIVEDNELKRASRVLSDNGFLNTNLGSLCNCFTLQEEKIEIHSCEDYDNEYFKNIFNIAKTNNGIEYHLSDEEHLLYVLCHIAKHFKYLGAGVKMFMDIDVLIRKIGNEFDYDKFILKCKSAGIELMTNVCFSLCSYWFNTPVRCVIDFNCQKELLSNIEAVVIDGGSFGYSQANGAQTYIVKNMSNTGENLKRVKIKALLSMFFPKARVLKNQFRYARLHPVLLPIAWINRIYLGVFKRGKNSIKTAKNILNSDNSVMIQKKLLEELEI